MDDCSNRLECHILTRATCHANGRIGHRPHETIWFSSIQAMAGATWASTGTKTIEAAGLLASALWFGTKVPNNSSDNRGPEAGTRMTSRPVIATLILPVVLGVSSCAENGLSKDSRGWVSFSKARSMASSNDEVQGEFRRRNGCIVFETPDGERFLPILPRGQQFTVQPEGALYQGRWVVMGLDTSSEAVIALRSDPIARACETRPAFIQDIVSTEPSLPIPQPVR